MKVFPQEVYLHGLGKLPDYCYSLDLSWTSFPVYVVTGGADCIARVWTVEDKTLSIHSELTGHQLGVNCVRFSPDGLNSIATASDDGKVVIWHKTDVEDSNEVRWVQGRILNVLDEVVGIAWSPCGTMIAAAVQREMTHIFSTTTGRLLARLDGHTNRVTGVCWDPLGSLIVSLSSDRSSRVFAKKKNGNWYPKALLKEVEATKWKLFISESHYPNDPTAHFFRRPEFSPDGSMVVLPGGLSEPDANGQARFVTHLFSRRALSTGQGPAATLTTPCSPAMAVRFHPRPWKSNDGLSQFYVFIVTTVNSFYVLRSDKPKPIAFGTDLHCTAIVDASWSYDGQLVALCSTDGYMTLVRFEQGELGGEPDWSSFVAKTIAIPTPTVPTATEKVEEPKAIDNQKRRITPMIVNTKE